MGPTRFERVTSRLSAVRSTKLSYGPGPHFWIDDPINNCFPEKLLDHLDRLKSEVNRNACG